MSQLLEENMARLCRAYIVNAFSYALDGKHFFFFKINTYHLKKKMLRNPVLRKK